MIEFSGASDGATGGDIPLYTTLDAPEKMIRNVVHEEHTPLGTTMVVAKKLW